MSAMERRWISETLFDDLGFRMSYEVERVIYELHTEHQHLILFEHPFFGKMLMLDGATQVTTRDEFVYHEMMTHVPIFAHGNAEEVLIVGGGDCGIAEEVLKHKSVTRLVQVEIDASVVEFAKEHFPEFTVPVLADKRFDLVIDDGMNYVAETGLQFDVIIVDFDRSAGAGEGALQSRVLCRLQAPHEKGRRIGHPEWGTDPANRRAYVRHQQISQAVCRWFLLRGGNSDLCWGSHGHGLGYRQFQITTSLGPDHRQPLQERRQLCDQILDARSARRGLCAAPLHWRQGGEGQTALNPLVSIGEDSACGFVRDVEIELDQNVVRILDEDLPAGAVGDLVGPK